MSAPYWLVTVAWAGVIVSQVSDLLPVVPAIVNWRVLSKPMRFTAMCTIAMLVNDLSLVIVGFMRGNNLWIIHLGTPVYAVLTLLAFAEWQFTPRAARNLRAAGALFVVAWVICTAEFEDLRRFSNFGRPALALLVCATAGWTLVLRSREVDGPLTRESWFWVCMGWLVLYAPSVLVNPVSNILLDQHSPLLYAVVPVRATFNIIANGLLMIGMLRERDAVRPELVAI